MISQFGEVAFVEARLKNDRAGMDSHAARAIGLETARRGNRERLDTNRILWTARHMDLGRRDRGRDAAVQITFQIADRLLPRRIIAEGNMDMAVDQAGNGGGAVGIDYDIRGTHVLRRQGADRLDKAIFTKNCIAGLQRRFPIAADDPADVYDGSLHPSLLDVSAMPPARIVPEAHTS